MTIKTKSEPAPSLTSATDEWLPPLERSDNPPRWRATGWLHSWLLLDDTGDDPRRWKLSAYRIIIASSLLLCLLVAAHSLATAWTLGITSVIVAITAFYFALIVALQVGERSPNLGASMLLLMVYACGLMILFGVGDPNLSALGVIFLYVAPVIAWIYFGPIKAFVLMVANLLPFLYVVSPDRPLDPFGLNLLMPDSHLYLHALLFLFVNVSVPLALFRVVSALNASVTRNREGARLLRQNNQLFQDVFEHGSGPVLVCDRGGRILRANHKACALLGRDREQLETAAELGDLFAMIEAGARLDDVMNQAITSGFGEAECLIPAATGDGREVLLTFKSLSQHCLLATIRDISSLKAMERDLREVQAARDHLFAYDQLTNLPNRESLLERLHQLMNDGSQFQRNRLLAVACLRLNSIRSINEKFGQPRGDALIRAFAASLTQLQHDNLQVFRLRGVVFLVVITGCTTPEQVELLISELTAKLPSQHHSEGQSIDLEISVGAAFTRGKEISPSDLIHRSERALDIARRQAKDPLVLFNEDSAREIHREIDISLALTGAITRNELYLAYQPKVDADKRVQGLEALVRWQSPELGNVPPAEFIPLAEQIGKIHLVSNFVIERVCRQLAAWHARFGMVWPVAINLSGIDLQRNELAGFIQNTLLQHHVEPAWLQLEITETGLIEHDAIARRNIERLIAIGLKIAIDDFGTGYSSLKKLSEYPIHAIKIDRSFVAAIGKNRRSDRIIQLIMTLAKVLDCEVVAEGVETRRQLQFLQDNGCRRFQGYLFHKPLGDIEIGQLLKKSTQ